MGFFSTFVLPRITQKVATKAADFVTRKKEKPFVATVGEGLDEKQKLEAKKVVLRQIQAQREELAKPTELEKVRERVIPRTVRRIIDIPFGESEQQRIARRTQPVVGFTREQLESGAFGAVGAVEDVGAQVLRGLNKNLGKRSIKSLGRKVISDVDRKFAEEFSKKLSREGSPIIGVTKQGVRFGSRTGAAETTMNFPKQLKASPIFDDFVDSVAEVIAKPVVKAPITRIPQAVAKGISKLEPSRAAQLEFERAGAVNKRIEAEFMKEQEIVQARERDLTFSDSEQEFGFQAFRSLAKNSKKIADIEDDRQLKEFLTKSNATFARDFQSGIDVDNKLFSGANDGLTNDDLLDRFKDRLQKEGVLRQVAKQKTPQEIAGKAKKSVEGIVKREAATPAKQSEGFVRRREMTLLKTRIRDFARGSREGVQFTKSEVKSLQDEVISTIEASGLEAVDKAKFLRTIKNIQTQDQLTKRLPEIEERIATLETKAERRTVKSAINKELKDTKVRKANGKPVGKFTPELQNILDKLRESSKLTIDQADAKIRSNLEKYTDIPPADVALENKILSMLTEDSTPEQLRKVLGQIQEMKETGQAINELRKFNVQSEIQAQQDFVIQRVTGGKGIEKGRETFGQQISRSKKMRQNLKALGKRWVVDWGGQMDILDFNNAAGDNVLAKEFSTLKQDNQYKTFQNDYNEDIKSAISESYGIQNKETKIHKQVGELSKKINLGKFKNSAGVQRELIMTKDEVIKRWMEFQDTTLRESFLQGNKFTDDIFDAIEKAMTPQDKVFADRLFKLYDKQWGRINPVYSEIYGVDLPHTEFYSPIRREGFKVDETKGLGEFLGEAVDRKALASGSFKTRVENTLPIAQQGALKTLERHITETNYFVAWAKKIREFRGVFNDTRVAESIKQEFGNDMSLAVRNTIDDLTTNGNRAARRYAPVDYFRKKFTVGALMLKPAIGVKQMVSTLAYLEKLSAKDFTLGVADFWKNPIKNARILNEESILIKTRGENFERDIKAAMKTDTFKRFSKSQNFINTAMMSIRVGDKGAVLTGSWAMRRAALKSGKSLQETISAYENFSATTQQSADLSRLSEVQRGGSFEQMFTMFKSSQRQYFAKELHVVKSLFQKGGFGPKNIKRVARTISIYHVLLPVVFQYISNLGGWDEDDKKEYVRAGLLGSVNGIFIFGDVVDSILRQALGLRVWDNEIPLVKVADDVNKAIRKLDFDDITSEDVLAAMSEFSEVGNTLGLPVSQAKNMFAGLGNVVDGNIKTGVAELLGWSPFHAEPKNKKKPPVQRIRRTTKNRTGKIRRIKTAS